MRSVHQLCVSKRPFILTLRNRPQQKIQVCSCFRRGFDVLSVNALCKLLRLFIGDRLNEVHFVAGDYIYKVLLADGRDFLNPRLHLQMTHFSEVHHLKSLLHGHIKYQYGSIFRLRSESVSYLRHDSTQVLTHGTAPVQLYPKYRERRSILTLPKHHYLVIQFDSLLVVGSLGS